MSATETPRSSRATSSDRVAGADLAFFHHFQIESRSAGVEKSLDHVGAVEADPQLVARHPRLGDDQLGGPDTKSIADADRSVFDQAVGGEILAEGAPRQRKFGQLSRQYG